MHKSTHHTHKAVNMPLSIKSLECPVRDWFAATSALGEHRVCVAAVAVRMAVLLPVAHTARELD